LFSQLFLNGSIEMLFLFIEGLFYVLLSLCLQLFLSLLLVNLSKAEPNFSAINNDFLFKLGLNTKELHSGVLDLYIL
jgi:hypothetical protein